MSEVEPTSKVCTKCHTHKLLEEFSIKKRGRYGRAAQCKLCTCESNRRRYIEQKEKILENCKKYRAANAEKVKAARKKYRAAHPEKQAERLLKLQEWNKANPEKAKATAKKWRDNNPEKVAEYNRRWREANPEKVKECRRRWEEANPEKAKAFWKEFNAKTGVYFINGDEDELSD